MQGQQNAIDFLKDNLQAINKRQYLQTIKQTLTHKQSIQQQQQNKMPSQQQLSSLIQQYEQSYRKFMHRDSLIMSSKSNSIIDQCLNNVHPGLKTKKDCKYILGIMSKIFVQQLIQQSFQVLDQYKRGNQLNNNMEEQSHNERDAKTINGGSNKYISTTTPKKTKRQQQIDIDVIEQAIRRRMLKRQQL